MNDRTPPPVDHETPEVVDHKPAEESGPESRNSISEPAKVMRIGSMIKQLLEEVRTTTMDEAGRTRLKDIYETSISELGEALSPDLTDELNSLALPFSEDEVPSDSELRIAQAQLVGWLEGLFHGIQATLFAQQMAARQQLEQMQHQQALPQGQAPRTGTYL
ncbi:MAG: bacterial proteasome activator family protein [Acidimicrobiales bacterium]|nr:bacterial proteasome activator family protein [Acidimicrobiales bacterium]